MRESISLVCVMEYVSDKAFRETIAIHTGSSRKGLGIEMAQFRQFFQRTQGIRIRHIWQLTRSQWPVIQG